MNRYNLRTVIILMSLVLSGNLFAQEKLRSTKLIKDSGIEELYQIAHTADGFIGIGLKGNDALQKKLWMIKFDEKMQITRSEILSNQALTDPFKILTLQNGNFLILAQLDEPANKKSILFCIDKKSNIVWAKSLEQNGNIQLLDMCLSGNNEIVFVGKEYLKGQLSKESDRLIVMKTNMDCRILWQQCLDLGHSEINPKNIFADNQNNIILNGTITLVDNIKSYSKNWFAIKLNTDGKVGNSVMAKEFANYTYANNIIPYEGGYLAAINNNNYFGYPALVELSSDLKVKNTYSLEGSPMLISGITMHEDKLIIAGVFSNTFNDYSPGYTLLDMQKNITISKSSPTLFKHFFITNILDLPEDQFMLSGIGYNEEEASDVYMMPFTSEGKSACNLNTHAVHKRQIELKTAEMTIAKTRYENIVVKNIDLIKSATGYEIADICTAPDDYIVDPSENNSWAKWKKNNKESFTIKVPVDWLEVVPNPAHDKVTVTYKGMNKTDALRLTIISAEGKMVMNEIIRNQVIFDIDISMLANGTYFFNLFDGRETQVKKVVKQ